MSDACLHLQSRHDLDVNLVLFAAFVGAERREILTPSNLEAARALVETWHREVIRPLRAVRKRLKTGPSPAPNDSTARLRRKVQQVEIEAELIELNELGGVIPGWEPLLGSGGAAEAAEAAIETVIPARKHNPIDHQDRQAIQVIAGAAALQIDS